MKIMMRMTIIMAMMIIMIVRIMRNDNDGGYGFIDCWVAGSQVTSEAATKIASFY